jgi:hypothetical protein
MNPEHSQAAPQQSTSDDPQPGWGAPQQRPPQRWSAKKTIAAVAIAIGVAGAGGAVVYAASNSSDASSAQGGPGGQNGGPGGTGGGMNTLGSALHGEFVVSDGNGGYTTELMQVGKVTAISSTSLTAASDDGFTKTYTIDANTVVGGGGQGGTNGTNNSSNNSSNNNSGSSNLSSIATGDTVTVVAKTSGNTATAGSVSERGTMPQGGQGQDGVLPRRDGN